MTKKEREAHFISYINPNNLHEYITKCSNCGCGLSNVAYYCPICGVKINKRVVHARDDRIIIYPSWIPVSERLPEKTDYYLVTVGINEYGIGMIRSVRTALFDAKTKDFTVHTSTNMCIVGDVVAWCDCVPEPYKTESEGECYGRDNKY